MKALLSLYEAKTHFSALAERVAFGGEQFTVTRHGTPMLKLVPIEGSIESRRTAQIAESLKALSALQSHGGARLSRSEILSLKDEGRKW